jgi:tetratricopeptide (TPR) repeat protein
MMKYLLILMLGFCSFCSRSQTIDDAYKLYENKQYREALNIATKFVRNGKTANSCALAGRLYVDIGQYDSSVSYLKCAIEEDMDQTWLSAWSHAYLGKAYIAMNNKKNGIEELRNAVKLNKTKGSTAFAMQLLEYVTDLPDWITVKKEHINYYFQDTARWSSGMQMFIAAHDAAYISINRAFKAQLPNTLSFYVWNDTALAYKILKHPLGFTNMLQCVSNVTRNQTIGHEMTHTLSYWGWGMEPMNETRFISEGTAFAFDQTKGDRMLAAKAAAKKTRIKSVTELWKVDTANDAILYPVAGAFVAYLFKKSTPAQFKMLIKDQSIASAEKTYGKVLFNKLVTDFDRLLLAK